MGEVAVFINGDPDFRLSPSDRALNYGHGLFETMRLAKGQLPLWEYHRRRLLAGAERLAINVDAMLLDRYVDQALGSFPDEGILRLLLSAGSGKSGYRPSPDARPDYILQWLPLEPVPATVSLQVCRYRLPENPVLAGLKHCNRLDQVMAAMELAPGFDGLLLDRRENVVEALSANLFWYKDDRWLTPALTGAGVAGVMRQYLLELLQSRVEQIDSSLEQLLEADAVITCNSVRGIRQVVEVAGFRSWEKHPAVRELIHRLAARIPCFTP